MEQYINIVSHSERKPIEQVDWGTIHPLTEFELELTARCNNACRHCYINLPAADAEAKSKEISLEDVKRVVDEVASLGCLGCVITGGEPLLREDFSEIYLYLKRKGMLVTVFTNATLVTPEHVEMFMKYPPRDIEVTVYGATRVTYERLTRCPGSYDMFMRGLDSLYTAGLNVKLKTMVIRSNIHEFNEIAGFCRARTDFFRFDPWLHLRYDSRKDRNEEIKAERITPAEFVAVETSDARRWEELNSSDLILPAQDASRCNQPAEVFYCGAGRGRFTVGYDTTFRLCSSLCGRGWTYDLRNGSIQEAYTEFVEKIRSIKSHKEEYIRRCFSCRLVNICLWCPANSYLETGELDNPVEYFCQIAHARARAMGIEL